MITSRRITLQLTPLLDMLLILLFAQYMEVHERQVAVGAQTQAVTHERDEALQAIARMQSTIELLSEADQKAQAESDLIRSELTQTQQDLNRTLAQHRVLGELVVEMFQIPPEEIDQILDAKRIPDSTLSAEDRARLHQRFQQLAITQPGRMIEHLLSYDEIRKRCDVWELHIDGQGMATVTNGVRELRIRIPTSTNSNIDQQQFVTELYSWYRTLPQPKSLVIILLTYDRESHLSWTRAARAVLPVWVSQMQTDSVGRTRFEYADLGFRID